MSKYSHIARSVVVGIGVLILLAACAGSGSSGQSSEFDPFGFPGEDSVVTAGVERTAIENKSAVSTTGLDSRRTPVKETETVVLVQFFTTTNYMEAEDVRRRASADLKEPVVVKFETPYYKLKAGPLPSKEAADRLALRLRSMGYE